MEFIAIKVKLLVNIFDVRVAIPILPIIVPWFHDNKHNIIP